MAFQHPTSEKFANGLGTRRAVLGDQYVDSALSNATEFDAPMQKLVTEFCWDEIWNRPGLDRRTRSLMNLAMISALNRSHELKAHVRGAINNGVTKEELAEVFLQVAVYCGMPAGIEGFRVARDVLKDMNVG
jgi:4-carboxymuconolactone decarboxylase